MVVPNVSILLVRHGQTEWNAARRWQGKLDSPLTPLGREQAVLGAAAIRNANVRPSALWASSLGRTVETANVISDRLDIGPIRLDDRLQEAGAGEWEAMFVADIEARYPGWLQDGRRPDTFEPAESVVDRVASSLRDIAASAQPGERVVAVTHSGVIRRLVHALTGADRPVANLGGVWVHVESAGSSASAVAEFDLGGINLGDRFDPDGIVDDRVDHTRQNASE